MIFHKQLGDDIVRVNMLFKRSREVGINIEVWLSTSIDRRVKWSFTHVHIIYLQRRSIKGTDDIFQKVVKALPESCCLQKFPQQKIYLCCLILHDVIRNRIVECD